MLEKIKPDSLYLIFANVIRLHYMRMHMCMDKIGIYPGQHAVLFALLLKNGQSQSDLSKKIRIKPATITVMIRRMERAGLLERKPDPEDQRISRIYLTEQGKKICKEVEGGIAEIQNECFSNFSEEEKIIFRRLLMQVRDNLTKVCGTKPDYFDDFAKKK